MVFFALVAQCAATLAVIRRETNSWRWPAFTFAYMTALAYVGALATYQVGNVDRRIDPWTHQWQECGGIALCFRRRLRCVAHLCGSVRRKGMPDCGVLRDCCGRRGRKALARRGHAPLLRSTAAKPCPTRKGLSHLTAPKMTIPDDPGRRGVVGVVVRDGRMLVIRRSRSVVAPLVYCFPGGGIEAGESEEEALVREFREEIGVTIRPVRRLWRVCDGLEGRSGVVAGRDGARRDAHGQSERGRVDSLVHARGDGGFAGSAGEQPGVLGVVTQVRSPFGREPTVNVSSPSGLVQ